MARSVAAFHLDKTAEVGLLGVEYRRRDGAGVPGAGTQAKWYRQSNGGSPSADHGERVARKQLPVAAEVVRVDLAAVPAEHAVDGEGESEAALGVDLLGWRERQREVLAGPYGEGHFKRAAPREAGPAHGYLLAGHALLGYAGHGRVRGDGLRG